jgi:hypothetical protein
MTSRWCAWCGKPESVGDAFERLARVIEVALPE